MAPSRTPERPRAAAAPLWRTLARDAGDYHAARALAARAAQSPQAPAAERAAAAALADALDTDPAGRAALWGALVLYALTWAWVLQAKG